MTPASLAQLAEAARIGFEVQYQSARSAIEKEARIRAALAALEQAGRAPASPEMAAVGADLAWQGWVDGRRRQLLSELAHARAHKLEVLDRVKTALGRKEAAQSLVNRDEQSRARRRALQWLEQMPGTSPG